MKLIYVITLAVISLHAAPPPPVQTPAPLPVARPQRMTCVVCKGTGKLVLREPDHGQHAGSIHSKEYWDHRLACTICDGRGFMMAYETHGVAQPGVKPCKKCGFSGVEDCRKCNQRGIVDCRKCKDGWIVEKVPTSANGSRKHMKTVVRACPECRGLGKVKCHECNGLRGRPCKKCGATGRDFK